MPRRRYRGRLVLTALAAFALALAVAWVPASALALLFPDAVDPVLFALVTVATALAFGYGSYRAGTTQLLSSLDAKRVPPDAAPTLHRRLDQLCAQMGLDRPTLYLTEMDAPNALALGGRGNGVVVLDHRLPDFLGPDELDAILAHELAHLEGYDALVQTLAQSLVNTITGLVLLVLLPLGILLAIARRFLATLTTRRPTPLATQLVRAHYRVSQIVVILLLLFTLALRAHSRQRELDADDRAVAVTGDPLALARGLRRIQLASDPYRGRWASLFIHGDTDTDIELTTLLDTHPDMDDRIDRLRQMADTEHQIPLRIR